MPEYVLRIVADGEDRGAVSLMGQIEGGLGRVGGGANALAGIFQGAGIAAFNLFSSVASGAIGAVSDAMIGGNAEFERYQTQFGVLLGSADAAEERLAALAEFGAKTPFELPEVVRADKILQAFGLHSENVAERFGFSGEQIRTIAGDVAAGTGAQFEEIAGYLGKFSSGATGEAIARMQELGIVTRSELAGMGLEFSKSGELLTPIDDAMDVLLVAMQDKFGGMMDAQSSTFEGMMSNWQDWLGAAGRTIGAPIFDIAKNKLGEMLKFVNSPQATQGLQALADGLGRVFEGVISGDDPIGRLAISARSVANAFGLDGDSVFAALIKLKGPFDALMAGFSALISFIQSNLPLVQATFQTVWGNAMANVQAVVGFFTGVLLPAIQEIVGQTGAQVPTMQQVFETVMGAISTASTIASQVLIGVIIPALTAVVQWVVANWPTIQATIAAVMLAIQLTIQTVLDWAAAFWAEWGDEILAVIAFLSAQWQTIFDAFSKAFEGDWRGFGETLRVAWDRAWEAISKIVTDAIEHMKRIDWGKVGADIVRGIANGITAATGFIVDAARRAAEAALAAIKGFLGIDSPSKVMANVIGRNMVLGVAEGLAQNWGLINSQLRQMPAIEPLGAGGNSISHSTRSYGGDTFVLQVSGPESLGMAEAFIDARRRERFNEFMGEG